MFDVIRGAIIMLGLSVITCKIVLDLMNFE